MLESWKKGEVQELVVCAEVRMRPVGYTPMFGSVLLCPSHPVLWAAGTIMFSTRPSVHAYVRDWVEAFFDWHAVDFWGLIYKISYDLS